MKLSTTKQNKQQNENGERASEQERQQKTKLTHKQPKTISEKEKKNRLTIGIVVIVF